MAQEYYEKWKEENQETIEKRVLDPDGLLTGNGDVSGVYELLFVNSQGLEISAYIGQAGEDTTAASYVASNIYQRILQHLKRWIGPYGTYWCGVDENDGWLIMPRIICIEDDLNARLAKEEENISSRRPFLQNPQGKYQLYPNKSAYHRNDICIHPWGDQRRSAFLEMQKTVQTGE